ncbi:hypothetical protein [Microbacterium oxydans]|uniref:hypothetical protein n=1 Tax=Microbacterium oxydans TaxID=82380 RepID=UPI0012E05510|nr:hypothetical protein [Microbacterium oxydans]
MKTLSLDRGWSDEGHNRLGGTSSRWSPSTNDEPHVGRDRMQPNGQDQRVAECESEIRVEADEVNAGRAQLVRRRKHPALHSLGSQVVGGEVQERDDFGPGSSSQSDEIHRGGKATRCVENDDPGVASGE